MLQDGSDLLSNHGFNIISVFKGFRNRGLHENQSKCLKSHLLCPKEYRG